MFPVHLIYCAIENINIGIVYNQQQAARWVTVILFRSPTERNRVIPNDSDLPPCEQLWVQVARSFLQISERGLDCRFHLNFVTIFVTKLFKCNTPYGTSKWTFFLKFKYKYLQIVVHVTSSLLTVLYRVVRIASAQYVLEHSPTDKKIWSRIDRQKQ